MSVNGATALRKMGDMIRIIEALSDIPARTAALAAPELNKLVQAQFDAGTDPYGRPWAPLRPATLARGRFPPPLTDTWRLRNGTGVRVRPGRRAGLVMRVGAPYGTFHQTGTRYMRARRILPQQGLPRAWRDVLVRASREACQSIDLGGARAS